MGDEQNVCRVLLWKPEARNHMEDLDVHRRTVFSLSERIGRVDIGWIYLAQDRDKQAVAKVVINLRLP
jgi:hypothetical protein